MKKYKFLFILLFILSTLSCVHNNFEVPNTSGEESNKYLHSILDSINNKTHWNLISIKNLKERFNTGNTPLLIDKNDVIKGYVVSSDLHQNFFQEIYIQDTPENPSTGIKIVSSLRNSYTKYNKGREVYIHLKDLYLGETNSGDGITAIGGKIKTRDTNEIDPLSQNQLEKQVIRSEKTAAITPKTIKVPEINDHTIGTLIRIENTFFDDDLINQPIVNSSDDFDTQRTILSCNGFHYDKAIIETSTFALFSSAPIPAGSGFIEAIVSKDFKGESFVLILNNFDDLVFSDTKCELLNNSTFTSIINEDFESTTGKGNLNLPNWTNFNEQGTKLFKTYDDDDTKSRAVKIGSFASRNPNTISWLITPPINLNATNNEFLSFNSSNSFADKSELSVLISTNWDGITANITSATWTTLPARIVNDTELFSTWVRSGDIDLSTYTGTAHIAFKYTGSGDVDNDGTFELDDIKVLVK